MIIAFFTFKLGFSQSNTKIDCSGHVVKVNEGDTQGSIRRYVSQIDLK